MNQSFKFDISELDGTVISELNMGYTLALA